jgi:hypothetical protein
MKRFGLFLSGANCNTMKYGTTLLVWVCLLAVPCVIRAQDGNDNPSFSSNIGMSLSAPLGPISRYASVGLGTDYSAGYNFNRRHAVVGEFMWNWIYAHDSALQPLRVASSAKISGHGNLFALTANYKYELRGKFLGTYLIGGGGWYYRSTSITGEIPTGTPIPCQPVWLWWGYTCGTTTNSRSRDSGSSAFGGNVGVGFTMRVGEPPYRWYVESRYHYAPTKNISTQLLTISVGLRY